MGNQHNQQETTSIDHQRASIEQKPLIFHENGAFYSNQNHLFTTYTILLKSEHFQRFQRFRKKFEKI